MQRFLLHVTYKQHIEMNKLSVISLFLGLLSAGCSHDGGGPAGDAWDYPGECPVVLLLDSSLDYLASTRAGGTTVEATGREKTVSRMQAVCFGTDGLLSGVYDVTLPSGTGRLYPYFDMKEAGEFRLYLVANAEPDLLDGLSARVGEAGESDLKGIVTGVAPVEMAMVSQTAVEVRALHGYVARVTASLERLCARLDVRNRVEGITLKRVEVINARMSSGLFPADVVESASDIVFPADGSSLDLAGNGDGTSVMTLGYFYESMGGEGDVSPCGIRMTYNAEGEEEDITVEVPFTFQDGSETLAMPVKRNRLYRIDIVEGESGTRGVIPTVVLDDWKEEYHVKSGYLEVNS